MKQLELTDEHIEKLHEMCEKLFPEYPYIRIEPNYGMNNDPRVHMFDKSSEKLWKKELEDDFSWDNVDTNEADVNIHWFEFVFLHLPGALQSIMTDDQAWRKSPAYVGNVQRWEEGDQWTFYSEFHFHYPKACGTGSRVVPPNPIDYLYDEFLKVINNNE